MQAAEKPANIPRLLQHFRRNRKPCIHAGEQSFCNPRGADNGSLIREIRRGEDGQRAGERRREKEKVRNGGSKYPQSSGTK